MSTSASINIFKEDGSFYQSTVHMCGDIETTGTLLLNNYTSKDKIEALIRLGNLRMLGSGLNSLKIEKDGFVSYRGTVSYIRDLGSTSKESTSYIKKSKSIKVDDISFDDIGNPKLRPCVKEFKNSQFYSDFNYLFIGDVWYVLDDTKRVKKLK